MTLSDTRDSARHIWERWGVAGEVMISFILTATILFVSNREALSRHTLYFVGVLYATFITFESPLSGMSMNPARTFGSAFRADYWHALWIYFVAPTLGMLGAGEAFLWYSTTDIEQPDSKILISKETRRTDK